MESVSQNMIKNINIIRNPSSSGESKSQALLEFYYLCIPISACFTDAYTLSRLFKKFKKNPHSPEKPYNVIIYSGDAHSNIYRTFLAWLKFDMKKEIKKGPYTSCIDLEDFPMPFFNSFPLKKENYCNIL